MDGWTEINRFWCDDDRGNAVEVIVRQAFGQARSDAAGTVLSYATASGERLESLDDGRFRRPSGAVLTKRASLRPRR